MIPNKKRMSPLKPVPRTQAPDAILQSLSRRRQEIGQQWKVLDDRKRQAEAVVVQCDTQMKTLVGAAGEVERLSQELNPQSKPVESPAPPEEPAQSQDEAQDEPAK